jgi:outer membrane lipoprotein SlyB
MLPLAAVVLMAGTVAIAACSTSPAERRAGYGIIESVTQVDRDVSRIGNTPTMSGVAGILQGHPATGELSQAASVLGDSRGEALDGARVASRSPDRNAYEVRVRMQDGSRQTFTQEATSFEAGERVRVSPDGRLVKP